MRHSGEATEYEGIIVSRVPGCCFYMFLAVARIMTVDARSLHFERTPMAGTANSLTTYRQQGVAYP
jgi:hypothetical protein